MVNAAIIFLQTSCVIPQAILLYRGRDVLPERYFNLGKWGKYINAIAVLWVCFLDILACFSTILPVNPENMSYVSVVCVGLVSFVVILWFISKKGKFEGPRVNTELMNARRLAALHADHISLECQDEYTADTKISRGADVMGKKEPTRG